jgi:hypothetical protein
MVAKSTKTKSKRRTAVKSKAKRGTKPLLARSTEVRKSKPQPRQPVAVAPAVRLVAAPLATSTVMGRVVQAYAELPGRLAQCRSPFDVWREQVRFAQRIFLPDLRTIPPP